ncbi:hypothetical protein C5167_006816 [Papaver somniferum]|uniref:Pectate lyase superfamily protein domain-containing protein n=1 Tax=Papaver somniferum TaxID=3469 RepID=A0A4Y7JFC8_PAPSO|nr:hypothetical protein C5167_006816 [Papaver somniferum]
MFSDQIQISNITLLNSPSWNVHPVYSSNILIQGLTILAPMVPISPNTDGINLDSCTNVRIEDCYIVSIASRAVIALGSEMSGGIQDVRAEDILAINSESGIRIKTAVGRGGF